MYCVRCGVRLQEGIDVCPLCETPVWNPEETERNTGYPDRYPGSHRESNLPYAVAMTVFCVTAILVILTVCLKLYGKLDWGGYAIGGIGLFYVIAVIPAWFRRPHGEIFLPCDHAAAALFVLYACLKNGGHWFLSFALPLILGSCLLLTALVCLLKYVKGGRAFILGGFLLGIGVYTVLVEFFEHLTFGSEMFLWSLYSLAGFGAVGVFLLLAGIIPSLRQTLRKRFFF